MNYLIWWRMTLAAQLPRDTNLSLSEIARRVGYSSQYAFAATFKREHGIAPGRYRQDQQVRPAAA